jgi:hypothetical protein
MNTVLNILLSIVALFVVVWIIIFGGIGALLSRSREDSAIGGLALGTLLGPIGWVVILWRTRAARRPVAAASWVGAPTRIGSTTAADPHTPSAAGGRPDPPSVPEKSHDW